MMIQSRLRGSIVRTPSRSCLLLDASEPNHSQKTIPLQTQTHQPLDHIKIDKLISYKLNENISHSNKPTKVKSLLPPQLLSNWPIPTCTLIESPTLTEQITELTRRFGTTNYGQRSHTHSAVFFWNSRRCDSRSNGIKCVQEPESIASSSV